MACIVGVVGVVSGGVEDTIKLPAHLRQICASRWVCGMLFGRFRDLRCPGHLGLCVGLVEL